METKHMVWLGAGLGGTIGSFIPMIWGSDMLSFSSIIWSGVGGIAGIYIFYKMSQ
jgi:hypothetical protein